MQWKLCLYPQERRDPSDPAPSLSFEKRLQESIAAFDEADSQAADQQQLQDAERRMERILQAISHPFSMVGQPSSRQLTRFWFLYGEIKLALHDHQKAHDALECCASLVAQNLVCDHISVNFLRARVAGNLGLFRKSMEDYAAVIEQLDQLQPRDFADGDGDLDSFRCYVYLQRAKHYLALGYFDNAQADMYVATSILDSGLELCGAPRGADASHDSNSHMHPAFADYAVRLCCLTGRDAPVASVTMRNWLHLCLEVPATYAAVEMWHTRLFMQERGANGLLCRFYELLIACANLSTLLSEWSATTTLLYYRAFEIAIIGHDVACLLHEQSEPTNCDEDKRSWLQRADQALVNVFAEQDQDDCMLSQDAELSIELQRHGLWLRQHCEHLNDFPHVPDMIEIGTGVRQLLQLAIAQGKTWSAACCNQLLGYIAMALGDLSDADCCLHDALALFEQMPGDIFYPRYEELRRAIASLNL